MNNSFCGYLNTIGFRSFLVVIMILLTASIACKTQPSETEQPESLSPEQKGEQLELKDYELSKVYQELKNNIEEAEHIIIRIQGFTWTKFSDIVWIEKDKYGVTKEHAFVDELPSRSDVEPIDEQMVELKGSVFMIWNQRPYKEPQSEVEKAEKLSSDEWLELCSCLKSDLIDLSDAVKLYKSRTEKRLALLGKPLTLNNFGQQYIGDYSEESNNYLALASELIAILDKAIQSATELESWDFQTPTLIK